MDEKHLMDSLAEALRAGGFTGIEKRVSSRSATVSARKGHRTAIVYIEDREAVPGPRAVINTDIPDASEIAVHPQVPSLEGISGSGIATGAAQTRPRKAAVAKEK